MTAPLLDEEQEMAYLEVAVEAVMLGSGAPVAALVAEQRKAAVVAAFRHLAAYYPDDVFPEDGTSRDAIAGTALRKVLTASAAMWERGERP